MTFPGAISTASRPGRSQSGRAAALVLSLALSLGGALPAHADVATCAGPMPEGEVVSLAGTPHIWVADAQGVLHWSGDTRALGAHMVDWGHHVEVSATQLRTMPLGDPWLTAGLLKIGDPIYLVKWETDAPMPTLLHIQSISDVEMFGISGANYGAMIFESPAWEAQFGMPVATLSKAELAAAASADDGYTADWSCGLNGWSGTADWQVSGGMLLNDGTNGKSLITAPYRASGPDYAVEAQIQGPVGGGKFGLALRNDETGFLGFGVSGSRAIIAERGADAAALTAQPLAADGAWHTYRAEVMGTTLKLFVDGVQVLQTATADGVFANGRQVGLYTDSTPITVRSYHVIITPMGNHYGPGAPAGSGTAGGFGSSGGGGGGGGGGSSSGGGGGGGSSSGGGGAVQPAGGTSGGTVTGRPPAAPTNLRAVFVAPSTIRLTWDDNSDNEDNFSLTAGWANNLKINTVGENATTSTLEGVQGQTTYQFTVAACNSYGCSGSAGTSLTTP